MFVIMGGLSSSLFGDKQLNRVVYHPKCVPSYKLSFMDKRVTVKYSNLKQVLTGRVRELIQGGYSIKGDTLSRTQLGVTKTMKSASEFRTKQPPFVQIAADIFINAKTREVNIITRIVTEIRRNNPLWYCGDHEKSEVKKGLSALEGRGVLCNIVGCKGFYLVNPQQIRNGVTLECYMALLQHIGSDSKKWKPSLADIRDLKVPDSYIDWTTLGVEI